MQPHLLPGAAARDVPRRRRRHPPPRPQPRARMDALGDGEAFRHRPSLGGGVEPIPGRQLDRARPVPHRQIPRQGGHRQFTGHAVRQPATDAHLEPGEREQRADYFQGALWCPVRVLRQPRDNPRRAAEPSAADLGRAGHGPPREPGSRGHSRCQTQGAAPGGTRQSGAGRGGGAVYGRPRARGVPGLPGGGGGVARTHVRHGGA
mmetsp:Transcript_17520/g.43428  ORF Transcript_17520/g.43428 Transcript_17520/m.43428 type:complete len:205 (-) Transcript_17520:1145-1759(-)